MYNYCGIATRHGFNFWLYRRYHDYNTNDLVVDLLIAIVHVNLVDVCDEV